MLYGQNKADRHVSTCTVPVMIIISCPANLSVSTEINLDLLSCLEFLELVHWSQCVELIRRLIHKCNHCKLCLQVVPVPHSMSRTYDPSFWSHMFLVLLLTFVSLSPKEHRRSTFMVTSTSLHDSDRGNLSDNYAVSFSLYSLRLLPHILFLILFSFSFTSSSSSFLTSSFSSSFTSSSSSLAFFSSSSSF